MAGRAERKARWAKRVSDEADQIIQQTYKSYSGNAKVLEKLRVKF